MLSKAMSQSRLFPARVPCSLSAFLGRKERAHLTEDYLSSSVFERQPGSLIYLSICNNFFL